MSIQIEPSHSYFRAITDARLMVVAAADESLADVIPLSQLPLTIGRSHENRIVLSHRLVSRVHCELYGQDGQLYVRDLGSLNGTFVGNKRIVECELRPGDLLTVGVVTFRAVPAEDEAESPLDGEALDHDGDGVLDTVPLPPLSTEATLLHSPHRSTHHASRTRGNGKPHG